MLLDAIATVILAGMMLVPVLNILVGVIVGAGLAGIPGCLIGLAIAILVTAAEKFAADRRAPEAPLQSDGAEEQHSRTGALRRRMRIRMRWRPLPLPQPLPSLGADRIGEGRTLH